MKFLLFKIYVFSKVVYVFNYKRLIVNFKRFIEEKKYSSSYRENYSIKGLPPIGDLTLLLDIAWYQQCVEKELLWDEWGGYDLDNDEYYDFDYELYRGSYNNLNDEKELADKIKESDLSKNMTFDVFLPTSFHLGHLSKTNYQILKSPNFSEENYKRYRALRNKNMMLDMYNGVGHYMGEVYLCPDSQELQYQYYFIPNIQIDKVIPLIKDFWGKVEIFISDGNLEKSLKKYLSDKSITIEKNYYYISKIELLQRKIDSVFKYIDYTFIVIWFIITIFIEQNYFTLLESSISSLLEFLKYYFLINHLI